MIAGFGQRQGIGCVTIMGLEGTAIGSGEEPVYALSGTRNWTFNAGHEKVMQAGNDGATATAYPGVSNPTLAVSTTDLSADILTSMFTGARSAVSANAEAEVVQAYGITGELEAGQSIALGANKPAPGVYLLTIGSSNQVMRAALISSSPGAQIAGASSAFTASGFNAATSVIAHVAPPASGGAEVDFRFREIPFFRVFATTATTGGAFDWVLFEVATCTEPSVSMAPAEITEMEITFNAMANQVRYNSRNANRSQLFVT